MPLGDALGEARRRAAADVARVREDAASPEEVERMAGVLQGALLAVLEGADPGELPRTLLARRVLELFRRHLVAVWSASPPAGGDLVAVMAAIETVADRLQPGWESRFTDRLAGPDGLELLVEVAHDLRSPLTSILFLAETLLRGRSGPVTPLQERQLGLIYSAAFGLSSVASDVVDLVRGRDRLTDVEPMPFSVTDIMESVRDIVKPIAEEKGLEMRLVTPGHPFRVGHPTALNRVLLNLTTNALKFTDQGRVEIRAEELEGETVRFAVSDTGRGIPPPAMDLLFEPFRRRQRDREYAFSGAGLGLSICRKLVEAMGSELQVQTELEKGTTFLFALALPAPSYEDASLPPVGRGV